MPLLLKFQNFYNLYHICNFTESAPADVNKATWMTQIRSHIGNKRIGDVFFPGSHDSGTYGINEDFILVNKNPIFELAEMFIPEVLQNWSITQTENFRQQLQSGFRLFDMRIADVDDEDFGNFRWWHGISADLIQEGIDHIRQFATQNPGEIIILQFAHFVAVGDETRATLPIPDDRKDELSQILLRGLGSRMVAHNSVPDNPTVNQVLSTGRNIIATMQDSYIRRNHPQFWPHETVVNRWTGRTNPEDLFKQRSELLNFFKDNDRDKLTEASVCVTPDERIVIGGLLLVFQDDPIGREIIRIIMPELLQVDTRKMSFEGMWTDLVTLAQRGVNTGGMKVRNPEDFTNGGSVHFEGNDEWIRYWLARPGRYMVNIINTDHTTSSKLVDIMIQANMGQIPREVSISFQGNTRDGFYEWSELETTGGKDGLNCQTGKVRYQIKHNDTAHQVWRAINNKTSITLQESQFKHSAAIDIQVGTDGTNWYPLFSHNIQSMIASNLDIYIRVADLGSNHGFGYVSRSYNLYGANCQDLPSNAEHSVRW